jgi:hypothetical protein
MMRSRILRALLILGLIAGAGGLVAASNASADSTSNVQGALVAISVDSPRGWYIDANGLPHFLPQGPNAIGGLSGDYPHMWFKGTVLDDSTSTSRTVTKTVTVNADFQAGSETERTITLTGLPAYSASAAESYSSNVGSLADSVGSIGITVPTATTGQVTSVAAGQTTRKFLIAASGFTGSESFSLTLRVTAS